MTPTFPQRGEGSNPAVQQLTTALEKRSIPVREKYISGFRRHGEQYAVTVDDYFAHEPWMKARHLVCPEYYSADLLNVIDWKTLSGSGPDIRRISVHLGYGASVTPLHFDWDFASVLHICLKGRRRVWLAIPQQDHFFPAVANSALVDFELMCSERRAETLRSFGCTSHDLQPGEFIRFPSFWWHLVEYLDASLAVSARAEINPVLRPLTMLPRSPELQRLGAVLATAPATVQIPVISKLIAGFHRSFSEGSEAVNQCCDQLGLAPMGEDPWIVPRSPVNSPSPDLITPSADEILLCRHWLFGLWPVPLPITDEDANTLASQMASSISRPQ